MSWSQLTIPPAPVLNSVGTGAAERQLSAAGSRSVVPLVYGEDRIAALILNVLPAAAGSSTLLVQLLWCAACDSVSALKLNDQDLPAGSSVTHYTGSQTATDAPLVAAFAAQGITYTATLAGYAYSVVSLPIRSVTSAEFNFAALIRGRKVYDPRKDSSVGGTGTHRLAVPSTWEWSANPTLCLADYSSSIVYGAGTPIDWTTVPAAANANEALVGGEVRRIVGVSFISPVEAGDAIETLRAYAGCWVLPGVNGVRLVPDADAASCASYSHAAGEIAAIQPLELRDTSRAPTAVEVIYTDRSKLPWRDASAIAQLPGAGTTKPWRLSQVRLPGVSRYSQARREAIERLNKLTLCDLSTSVEIFDIGIRHEIGDIILLTHPLGLAAKPMRVVVPRRMGPGRWQLDLVEHDSAVYSNEVVAAPTVADTAWVSPAGPPAAVTGLTATPDELGVMFRWDANPEKDVTGYELRIGGTSWETALPLAGGIKTVAAGNSYRWLQPASGTYVLRIKAVDSEAMASATATALTVTVTSTKLAGIQAGATVGAQWGVNVVGQPADAAILNSYIVIPRGSLNADPELQRPDVAWDIGAGLTVATVSGAAGFLAMAYLSCVSGVDRFAWSKEKIPLNSQRRYSLSAQLNAAPGNTRNMYIVVSMYAADGSFINGSATGWGGTYAGYAFGGPPTADGTWRRYGAEFGAGTPRPIPAAAAYCYVGLWFQHSGTGSGVVGQAAQDLRLQDITEAAVAKTAADAAGTNASAALVRLQAIDSDGVLSRGEKPDVIARWLDISNEQGGLDAQAALLGISAERSAWQAARTALGAYLDGLSPAYADTTQDTVIVPAVSRAKWADYYSARQTLLNRITAVFGSAGGANMIWGAPGTNAGPGTYGRTLTDLRTPAANPFALLPGEQLTISADVWQDSASAAAGQYAAVYLVCKNAAGTAGSDTVILSGSGQTQAGSRVSATLTLPADVSMQYVSVVIYHHGGSTNTVGTVYCDRVQVERGPVATQYGPGGEPGATRNQVYDQDSDPGAVPDGSIWITSTRSYQRWLGAWRPYVGPGSVGTDLITPGAATALVEKFIASVAVTGQSFVSARDSYAASYSPIGFIAFTPDFTGLANIFVTGVLEVLGTATYSVAGVDRQITIINADINGDGIAQLEDNLAYIDQARYVEAGGQSSYSSHIAGRLQVSVVAGVVKTLWLYGQMLGFSPSTHTLKNLRLGLEGVKR